MCGIAGFFSQRPVSSDISSAMLAALSARGPDAQHASTWNAAFDPCEGAAENALLHARLSIIDPRPQADQPMPNSRADIWICYNGEVYDWSEQRQELERDGYQFRTHSDTEFILLAYEAWGIDRLLSTLRGMFAFAILDLRHGKVHLARDRMGEKPMLYSLIDGNLAFGSLVRSILPFLPTTQRTFNPEAIDAYLAHRYIPAPRTIFKNISRLENGHCLEFDLKTRTLSKRRYWQPQTEQQPWLPALQHAVTMRTVADRPLGVLLSGGVDSAVIASSLVNHPGAAVPTFTATFPGSSLDESSDAAATASALAFSNQAVEIPSSIAADFERIIADLDQPFADPSCFPTWYLAREVSRHVKVVLVGDGGDELLAGYKRTAKHLRTGWRRHLTLPLRIRPALSGKGRGKWISELSMSWLESYSLRFSGLTPAQRMFLQPGHALSRLCYWRAPDWKETAPVSQLLAVDFANYLPEYILQKSDLCTMAHGLEARAPLVDHHLFQRLMAVAPVKRYTRPAKQLLAPALDPRLPPDLLHRKKRGFSPPLSHWLHHDLAHRLPGLGSRLTALTQGQLNEQAVNDFAGAYLNGEESLAEQVLQLLILDVSLSQLNALAHPDTH